MSEGKYSELSNIGVRKLIAEMLGYTLIEQTDRYIAAYVIDPGGRMVAPALPVHGASQAWTLALTADGGIPNWPEDMNAALSLLKECHLALALSLSKTPSIRIVGPLLFRQSTKFCLGRLPHRPLPAPSARRGWRGRMRRRQESDDVRRSQ